MASKVSGRKEERCKWKEDTFLLYKIRHTRRSSLCSVELVTIWLPSAQSLVMGIIVIIISSSRTDVPLSV